MADRIFDALENGDLRRDEFGVLTFLVRAVGDSGERVFKLAALGRLVGWEEKGLEQLRRVLAALEEKGWIVRIVRPGQHAFTIRLTGAALATSTSPPPDLHLTSTSGTSTSVEVESGANPLPEGDRPPPDLHQVEDWARTEVEVELEDDVVTSTETGELERLLDEVDRAGGGNPLTPTQRTNARVAWGAWPDWVRSIAQESLNGGKPVALFASLLAAGPPSEKPTSAASVSAEIVFTGLTHYIRNEGCNYDWSMVEEEIARRETSQRVRLTPDQQQDLFEQWLDEHIELGVG